MQRIAEDNIGFALVKRRFESSGRVFMSGEELDRDFLLRMPRGNRDAMCDSKQIEIYPRAVGRNSNSQPAKGELHLRAAGVGVYDVIQGTIVASSKTKEEAQAIIDGKAVRDDEPGMAKKLAEIAAGVAERKPRRKAKRKAKRAKKARAVAKPREPKAPRAPKPETAEQQNGPID